MSSALSTSTVTDPSAATPPPAVAAAIDAATADDAADARDEPLPEGALPITHFNFTHRVFQTPGARFILKGSDHIPTFRVDMGDNEGLVDIETLKKEFCITPDSHDGKLVDLAVQGLRYVPDIKPGDSIPSEILNGTASWTISPRHRKLAEQRLQIQLLSWVGGKEVLLTSPDEIATFLEQLENKEKLRTAFRDAAVALGYSRDNIEPVIKQIELLAREVCYIEALRDRYALIPKIGQKIDELTRSLGNDRTAKLEANRIRSLLNIGIREYQAAFNEADAQTGEIISALKTVERQVKFIRQVRDDLHFLLMQWHPHISNLEKWKGRRTPETDRVMSALYRFLAPRYSSGQSMLKRRSHKAGAHAEPPNANAKRGEAQKPAAAPPKTQPKKE